MPARKPVGTRTVTVDISVSILCPGLLHIKHLTQIIINHTIRSFGIVHHLFRNGFVRSAYRVVSVAKPNPHFSPVHPEMLEVISPQCLSLQSPFSHSLVLEPKLRYHVKSILQSKQAQPTEINPFPSRALLRATKPVLSGLEPNAVLDCRIG